MENKSVIKILVLACTDKLSKIKNVEQEWDKYFNIEVTYDDPRNIENYLEGGYDILFIDDYKLFNVGYYEPFQENNSNFAYVVLRDMPSEEDEEVLKYLCDRIVYTEVSERYTKWSTISSLRRLWNTSSKDTTIIYKNIIVDFSTNEVTIDKVKKSLTVRESVLLYYFLKNKNKLISKEEMYISCWNDGNDVEVTDFEIRVVDQILFKLKKKVGSTRFATVRGKGVIFG